MQKKLVLYCDETTFNLWQTPKKLWAVKGDQKFPMQSKRGKSVTLIGAIDAEVGLRPIILRLL